MLQNFLDYYKITCDSRERHHVFTEAGKAAVPIRVGMQQRAITDEFLLRMRLSADGRGA
jgi:hypothetical protein